MKILIADRISPIGVDLFKAQKGFDVVEAYGSSPEEILELAKDSDAIAVRSDTRITAEVISVAPNLKVVGRAGVGVDNTYFHPYARWHSPHCASMCWHEGWSLGS